MHFQCTINRRKIQESRVNATTLRKERFFVIMAMKMVMSDTRNNDTKNTSTVEVAVSDVFVVNNPKRRPFIEQFRHTGINFTQKDLGTIMGFFIVRDTSAMSENIVNFLVSEIKKYYFSQSNKTLEEKFEATLHRVNRMLEELATIGNINWLGTIDGAVCAITHTTIRFSVTGGASIFLLRDNHLIDIGDGLASDDAAHNPLKTFVDISTGELRPYDKIIITSSELLELVSFDELQKNAMRMSHNNFVQFVRTALSNQCDIAVALIANLYPVKEKKAPVMASPAPLPTNFFGAPPQHATADDALADVSDEQLSAIIAETDTAEDYVDPQTGHIYMHGSDTPPAQASVIDNISDTASDALDAVKQRLTRQRRWLAKRLRRKPSSPARTSDNTATSDTDMPASQQQRPSGTIIIHEDEDLCYDDAPSVGARVGTAVQSAYSAVCRGGVCVGSFVRRQTVTLYTRAKRQRADKTPSATPPATTLPPAEMYLRSKNPAYHPSTPSWRDRCVAVAARMWHTPKPRTKLIAVIVVGAVIAILIAFALVRDRAATRTNNTPQPAPTMATDPEPSEPAPTAPALAVATELSDGKTVVQLKGNLVAVGARDLVFFNGTNITKTLSLPDNAGTVAFAAAMDDLNMIFILTTNNAVYTVGPADDKFVQQSRIPAMDHTAINGVATYMTYFYTVGAQGIMRYTRINNGFDAGRSWLKDTFNTATASIAIDENIYLADGNAAAAFLSGRATAFSLHSTVAHPRLVFATPRTTALWVVDTDAATIYKIDKKTGDAQSSVAHPDLADTTSFVVDESTQTAFLLVKSAIKILPLTASPR